MPRNANTVWCDLMARILNEGHEVNPRGFKSREILCSTSIVDMSSPVVTIKARNLGRRFQAAEAWWILSGKNDVASITQYSKQIANFSDDGLTFSGAYGPMVVDQLRYVVDSLYSDLETRQAVMTIWRRNPRQGKDIPCTVSCQWLIRNGKLDCIDSMRSSDTWLGWPYDVFNFSMLSAYILLMLRRRENLDGGYCHTTMPLFGKVELGKLYLVAGSQHLYERDFDKVRWVLNRASDVEQYDPLDLNEFSSPGDFLKHLELLKDRKDSGYKWQKEFLLKK